LTISWFDSLLANPRTAPTVAAEAACRLLDVEYEILPAVFDPELAMEPGAPILHDKDIARDGNFVETVKQLESPVRP